MDKSYVFGDIVFGHGLPHFDDDLLRSLLLFDRLHQHLVDALKNKFQTY